MIIFIIVCAVFAAASQPYKKIIHNTDPQAKCLDGSPALLYFHPGTQTDKFLIYFEGSGVCTGLSLNEILQSCYQMSKTFQGSSDLRPDTIDRDDIGILSTNATKNKFATWNKIIIPCCTGTYGQGYRQSPISYKNTNLYIRGGGVTRSHFKWLLNNHNLANASMALLTGSSAGGVATFIWSNYLRQLLNNPYALSVAPDSAMFMRYPSSKSSEELIYVGMVNFYKFANIDEKTPLDLCNRANPGSEWKCLLFQYAFAAIQPRALVIHSEYDSWMINNLLEIDCLSEGEVGDTLTKCNTQELAYIQGYRSKLLEYFNNFLMFSKNSVWAISCAHHAFIFDDKFYSNQRQKAPVGNGITIRQAYESFIFNQSKIVNIDSVGWPKNEPCAY